MQFGESIPAATSDARGGFPAGAYILSAAHRISAAGWAYLPVAAGSRRFTADHLLTRLNLPISVQKGRIPPTPQECNPNKKSPYRRSPSWRLAIRTRIPDPLFGRAVVFL